MLRHPVIKRVLSGFLLALFAFSITPKQLLHDIFANHKDAVYSPRTTDSQTPQVNKAGFNCHCDNLVAESPFTDNSNDFDITTPAVFITKAITPVAHFHSTQQFFFELRGPPARI